MSLTKGAIWSAATPWDRGRPARMISKGASGESMRAGRPRSQASPLLI
jgi:hypothetical protein